MGRILKAIGVLAALALLAALAAGGWFWVQVGASVPDHDGELALAGLNAPVTVERDALGVVTIRSSDARDEAHALGFVHAQERFFQMDLLRRSAAGELAALFGPAAVETDQRRRVHELRRTADAVVAGAPADYRALLEAYADGVNAGLAALDARPFEYLLLRAEPVQWTPADSVLAVGAMFFDLQGGHARHERNELVARTVLPAPFADFLYPRTTTADAPLVGAAGAEPVIPGPEVYDLRELPPALFDEAAEDVKPPPPRGSNNWAVAGAHTASGRGLLANDMHLGLGVPSTWFRTRLERDGGHVTGVSLPGSPLVVVGSNGHVAWGFTNSYGDWLELTVLEPDAEVELVSSPIAVAGGEPRPFEIRRSAHGPVIGEMPDGRPYAVRWVAHDPRAYAPGFLALADARSVDQALAAAQRSGIPHQNFVVADADGDIGWTIMGWIPDLPPDEYPQVVNPDSGRIWTANSRVVSGAMLERIGDGSYAHGQRARQIRDRLLALDDATPADMLAIQLDAEALFYGRWREQLLETLADSDDPGYIAIREGARDWDGIAERESIGYQAVRGWRQALIERMLAALTAEVRALDPDWRYIGFRGEEWAWPLVRDEPAHLLDPRFGSWHALKLAAVDDYLRDIGAGRDWGNRTTVVVRHPLSRALPLIGGWLDMPSMALPGDTYTPRVQGRSFGASQRMAVSPGDEANGYFHMPGGQSGNPRSPYYGAGHADWALGRPTPFLPGPPQHTLRLAPAGGARAAALPSGPGARAPNLSRAPDGSVLLSWIEPAGNGHALRFARYADGAWGEPATIAGGDDWFVNWADFPALVELDDGTLVAHWLQKRGPAVYAYDVMVTRSVDGGASWSAPESPHDDGTATEHGFVSLLPLDGAVRVVWLDGRETGGGHGGMMTLRSRTLTADGRWGDEVLLDDSVCDCCQTAAVATPRGVSVAYRDRSDAEIRDVQVRSLRGGAWTGPLTLGDDGWRIDACPVNGPAMAARGERVAVAWFSGAGGVPRAWLAFSRDGGDSFGAPRLLEQGATLGRLDLAWLDDDSVLVSQLVGDRIRVQHVRTGGDTEALAVAARASASRAAGFPRLAVAGDSVLLVWTEAGEPGGLRGAVFSPPSAP